MKQVARVEESNQDLVKYKFSFPNTFKIKDKILINFSVASRKASWSHQNIKIRIKELIHIFLTGWLRTYNWIHFLKWSVVWSNFFPVFYTLWQHHKHSWHHSYSCIHNRIKITYAQQLACKRGLIAFMAYMLLHIKQNKSLLKMLRLLPLSTHYYQQVIFLLWYILKGIYKS